MGKTYSVEEAIWLAAAVFAYEKYVTYAQLTIDDVYLEAPELQKIAQKFTDKTVHSPRIHQHNNGDHIHCNHRSIRRLEKYVGHPVFRVTATGEFNGDREYPRSIAYADEIEFNNKKYSVGEIKNFLDNEYVELVKKSIHTENNSVDIDYLGILKYLENNREVPYKDPAKPGLSDEEREGYLAVKRKGQQVVAELKKIHALCREKFNLEKCEKISWDDGSHTKTKGYLWVPMKYKEHEERPESISIFVELAGEKEAGYRVSLELRNDKATPDDVETYHKHLELPLNDEAHLIYTAGSNEWGRPDKLDEPQESIIEKVKHKEYNKVQICRRIEQSEFSTNAAIQKEIFKSIEALIPYYKYVLGTKKEVLESMNSFEMKTNKTENFNKNIILYGPPGTGKTYKSAIYAVAICDGKSIEELTDYAAVMKRYEELKEEGRIAFTTFHQSYGYEEFIEGIAPVIDAEVNASAVMYKYKDGVFKEFCKKAAGTEENKPYVFVIDEINRGNISKIFGELITLIESTKRAGMPEAIETKLPYTQKPFSVPANVYILGTMNTADRSIQLMDTALRRRFSFIEMMPDEKVLKKLGISEITIDGVTLNVAKMLYVMNERIAFLFDREHTIGHAFFTGLKDEPTIEKLSSIFKNSIIPLLQEYFYEDYQKIQLVLGDNAKEDPATKFIIDKKIELKNLFMGNVEDVVDEKEVKYEINSVAFDNIEAYKLISKGL